MRDKSTIVNLDRLDAVIFGLDGVLTDTAQTHAACWKHTFDEFLRGYDRQHGTSSRPFDIQADYYAHVEGRSRRDGVRSLLGSRRIALPEGDVFDTHTVTVDELADRKNALFLDTLDRHGVAPYKDAVELLLDLHRRGAGAAVVSPSQNRGRILAAARMTHHLDVHVDGMDLVRLDVVDRVYPVLFGEATRRLAVSPKNAAVVVETAAGVEAARRGGFGLVIGVDRRGHRRDDLERSGAQVVRQLSDLAVIGRRHEPLIAHQ